MILSSYNKIKTNHKKKCVNLIKFVQQLVFLSVAIVKKQGQQLGGLFHTCRFLEQCDFEEVLNTNIAEFISLTSETLSKCCP